MNHLELARQSKRISNLFDKTRLASSSEPELQAHWARYICILISGFLENSVRLLYSDFVRKYSDPAVYKYVTKQLEWVSNPNEETLLQVAGSFKNEWREELQKFLDLDGRKEAVNGIINARNQIAHGKDTGISMVILKDYYTRAIAVIDFIEHQLQ